MSIKKDRVNVTRSNLTGRLHTLLKGVEHCVLYFHYISDFL